MTDYCVCEWDFFGGFWRIKATFTGLYAEKDATNLAGFWNRIYNREFRVKNRHNCAYTY